MKLLNILMFILIFAVSCGKSFEEGGEGSSGLFASHKSVEDEFTIVPLASQTYLEAQSINIVLEHPYDITVSGTPLLPLVIGGSSVNATYISGSGSKSLTFSYTVASGDLDLDGISVGSAIDLNGGAIDFYNGTALQAANITLPGEDLSGVYVDAVAPSVIVNAASIVPGVYMATEALQVIAIFAENVNVVGTPQAELDIGGTTVTADYLTGSGGTTLIFRYTIAPTDVDLDGVVINSINLNGGSIKDLAGNNANLAFVAPTTASIVDGDTPYVVSYNLPADGTYTPGEKIEFDLVFSEVVDVAAGIPDVGLDIDGTMKQAFYYAGSGTDTLSFRYTVFTGDVDFDGATIDGTINLNSATIQDGGGTNALTTMSPPLTPNVLINGVLPQVESIIPPANNTYLIGQELYFTFKYNVVVNLTGLPRIPIILNSEDPTPVYAEYSSGSGTKNLVFRYVVTAGHEDLDGVAIQSPIDNNGGTIIGYNGVTADHIITTAVAALDTSSVLVDDKKPTIISLLPPADQNYPTGLDIDFTIQYQEAVIVGGTPRLAFNVGGSTVYADYNAGVSTATDLVFRYTPGAGDLDDNGIEFASNLIDLNGGSIQDAVTLNAYLDFTTFVPDLSGIKVNYDPPVILSITPPVDQYYNETDVLGFTVNTSVNVDIAGGTPRIELDIGGQQIFANYVSGTGTTALQFAVTLGPGLEDHDGITMVSALDANGATLVDGIGNNLDLTYTLPDTSNIFVDSLTPYIVSVSPPANNTYIKGDAIDFILNYNENVDILGIPKIAVDLGGATVYADYASGSGSNTLTFTYTVLDGDEDTDGLAFVGTTLDLSGGTIKDAGANDTNINMDAFTILPSLALVIVDGVAPVITSVTPPANNTYVIADNLDFIVNFDDNIDATNTPRIPITLTTGTVYANYLSGTGTNALTFRYTVAAGQEDTDGVDLVSPLDFSGGATLQDVNGNDAVATYTLPNTTGIIIDGLLPEVTIDPTVTITAANVATYPLSGTCSEETQAVNVNIGGVADSATCTGGVWSTTTDVSAAAESADNTVADVAITADHQDAGANSAVQATDTQIKDTIAPTISSNTIAANTYIIGDQVDLVLTFDENITSAGSEQVDLTIGLATVQMSQTATTANTITYSYTVVENDLDTDGLANAASITIGAGSIEDAVGNPLTNSIPTTNHATAFVDGVRPTVTNVTIAANTYYATDTLSVSVQFDEVIDVTGGSPEFALTFETVSGGPKAIYGAGTGSNTLSFDYTVAAGNEDTNGIDLAAAIALAGATIKDINGNDAYLALSTTSFPTVLIDAIQPTVTIDPTVTITAANVATYPLSGTCSEETQAVNVNIGGVADSATCTGGAWSTTTDVSAAAESADNTVADVAITADHQDAGANSAVQATDTQIKDTIAPTISSNTIAANTYIIGDQVDLVLTFDENITSAGSEQVDLTIGLATVQMSQTATTANTITYSYTVVENDLDTDGLANAASITIGAGSIVDAVGNPLTNTIPTTAHATAIVDGVRPSITNVTIAANTYGDTDQIDVVVTYDEIVTVAGGSPEMTFVFGTEVGDPKAVYASGTGGTTLTFSYTVATGNEDTDGIDLPASIALAGSTMKDANGNDADLALSTTNFPAVLVDAILPLVAISTPANASYINIASDAGAFMVAGTCDLPGYTVVIKVDGVAAASPTGMLCDGASFTGTIDTTGLGEGLRAFTAELTDGGGNTGTSATNNVEKDTVAPVIALDALADVSQANETSYTVSGTCDEDGATVDLAFGALTDSSVTCSSGTFSKTGWNVSGEADNASVLVTADVSDAAGNPATQATTNIIKDTIGPAVAITTPADSSTITSVTDSATFTVDGTCDENGQTVNIQIGGVDAASQVGFLCDGTNFTGTIDTTGLTFAVHSFTAILSDAIGNSTTSSANSVEKVSYLVTITAPAVINISNATTYTVSGTCSTNTEIVTVTIGGSVVDTPTCTGGAYTTASMDVSGLGDSATLSITADHGTASDSTTVLKDTLAPTVSLDTLANIAIANETSFPVTGTCSDNGENIDVAVGAATASGTCSGGTFSINVNTSIVSDGTSITVTADHQDAVGNPSTQASTTTDKDATAPTVAITYSPDITAANQASYSISGSCSENGQTVNVDIDGLLYTPSCYGGSWSVGPTDVSSRADNANLPITANTTDSFGNVGNGSTTVDKTTSVPIVAITNAPDINQANLTSYVVSGTCSENGTAVSVDVGGIVKNPNCSSGTWATSQIDATGLADGTVNITADHSTATQASTSVNKDTASATVTITSAPNITISNELTYVASGTCSENGINVDVYIDTLNYIVSCSSGTWTTGLVDVSSLSDGTGLLVTADHSTATQATQSINKETATPTVASLSVSTTLPDSADITWNLNDPGGFTIDDYTINYRVKGSPTWLTFIDGVSTATNPTVTSLTASTTYEFRVRVEYDSGSSSEWSNTAEGETQPDDPLFGPNTAMNVGGSTTTTVVAHEDGTNITLNGGALVTLNKGQTHTFATVQFDVIDADKPIYTAGRRGTTNAGAGANITWNPTVWAGKNFSFNATRTNPQKLKVYAIEDTFVEVKQGSTVLDSATITSGNGATLTWSVYGSYQVIATGSVLAFHMSTGSGNLHDPKPLLPAHTEMIGFPSQSMRLTASNDGTNYNLIHSNSTTGSGSLNKADVIQVNNLGGTTSLYQGDSLLISADKKISGASFADSNGLCAAPFMPTNLMKTKYAINVNADYAAFASKAPGTIEVRDASDTLITTLTLARSGGNSTAPYKVRIANPNAGYRFIAAVPVAAWYQPRTNTGAADQDETILYGTN